jgi:hypothetical protein
LGIRDSIDRVRVIRAWHGTPQQLTRILDILPPHVDKVRHEMVGDDTRYNVFEFYCRVTVVMRERATGDVLSRNGSHSEILSDLLNRQIVAVKQEYSARPMSLSGGNGWGTLTFAADTSLGAKVGPPGVRLEMYSAEPAWSRDIVSAIETELRESEPWWSFLRAQAGRWITVVATVALLFATSFLLMKPLPGYWPYVGGGVVALSGFALTNRRVMDWLLPSFEVSPDGSSSGTKHLLAAFSGVFLAVLVGIVVNRLS